MNDHPDPEDWRSAIFSKMMPAVNSAALDSNLTSQYKLGKVLGRGSYGIVYKATSLKSGQEVAVKHCYDCFRNRSDAFRTYREVSYLQYCTWNPELRGLHRNNG